MNTQYSIAALAKFATDDLIQFVIVEAGKSVSATKNAAKGIIALVDLSGGLKTAKAALRKAGLSEGVIHNALPLVSVYDAVVRTSLADEAWFDTVLASWAVQIDRAIARVGAASLAEAGMFKRPLTPTLIVEFSLVGDTGLTKKERLAKEAKKEAKKAAAAKDEDAKDSDEEEKESTAKKLTPREEFAAAVAALTRFGVALANTSSEDAAYVREQVATLVAALPVAKTAPVKVKAPAKAKTLDAITVEQKAA